MDRRAARTRKALHVALMSLVRRKGYEAITVQDILDEADVGRSTFYSHYTGKEDLLRRGFEMLRVELEEARRAARARTDGSRQGVLGFSLAMFEHAAGHADVYRALIGSRGHTVAIAEIRRVLLEMAKKELSGRRDPGNVPEELMLQFVVGTFHTVLTWWLERKPKLAPAQVHAMFRELVLGGVRPARERGLRS
jgi:AcrR family transcriptional regulator